LLTLNDGDTPEQCVLDNAYAPWTEISRDEFRRRDALLNDPTYIVPKLDKTPGLWKREDDLDGKSGYVIGVDPATHYPIEWDIPLSPVEETITGLNEFVREQRQESKFKPGDTARVTERIRYWTEKLSWDRSMHRYIDTTITIEWPTKRNDYVEATNQPVWVCKENHYSWPENCLELVKKS
jgi:hypothetical protein